MGQEHDFEDLRPVPGLVNPFDVNIVCINPSAIRRFAAGVGPDFFSGRYTVGYWAWELEEVPDSWLGAFDFVDAVWMNSEHAAIGVRRRTTKPVRVFPVPVGVPAPGSADRRALGLPDGFMFLFVFDYASTLERKNPVGLVRAFKQAFASGEGPVLVVKSVDGDRYIADRERLCYEVEGRPDILLLEGYWSPADKDALMASCDCYVSLHCSEGFGLTMAEAMALGKPTIATGYSGNLEFMTPENSFLVGFGEGRVPPDCRIYQAGAMWAEPDLDEAAAVMRRVYTNPGEARRVGERARADMARLHGPEARARLLGELLARIRSQWVAPALAATTPAPAPTNPVAVENPVSVARQAAANALRSKTLYVPEGRHPVRSLLARVAYRIVRPYAKRGREVDESILRYVTALHASVDECRAQQQRMERQGRRPQERVVASPAQIASKAALRANKIQTRPRPADRDSGGPRSAPKIREPGGGRDAAP